MTSLIQSNYYHTLKHKVFCIELRCVHNKTSETKSLHNRLEWDSGGVPKDALNAFSFTPSCGRCQLVLFDRDTYWDHYLSVSTTISLGQNVLGPLIAAWQFSIYFFSLWWQKNVWIELLMSQSIPTGYIPLPTPGKVFWAGESRPPGQFFLSNSLPRGKNDGRIPGGRQNFPNLEETAL